jgi:16S rRNA processing protein RimM
MTPGDARFVSVGRVGRPHGLDGSFFVEDPSDDPARLAVGAHVWAAGEEVEIVAAKRSGGRPVIRLDRPVGRGAVLEVPAAALPALEEGEYYAFQLEGLRVEEEGRGELGVVTRVVPGVANDVLELDSGLVLPLVEDCVLAVEVDAGRIVVARGFADPEV